MRIILLTSLLLLSAAAFWVSQRVQERVLWQERVELTITGDPSESRGTVFTWRGREGLVCGAGFIAANSARIFTNQNDLEFWCRRAGAAPALTFGNLGRPTPDHYKVKIANVGGRLLEYLSGRVYDAGSRRWLPFSGDLNLGGGRLLRMQNAGDRQYALVKRWKGCAGIAVLSRDGYHGSLQGRYSAAFFYRGRVFANLDYKIVSYPVGPAGEDTCRVRQDATVHVAARNWVYTMFPFNGSLYVGGSAGEAQPCAALYRIDDSGTAEIPIKGCVERPRFGTTAAELYAQMVYRDGLLVGVFPHGNLARVADGTATLTDWPIRKHDTVRYFEPQSLTIAAGDLFVGMYPWGQLFRLPYGDDDWRSQRLFPDPPILRDGQSPFRAQMVAKLHALPFMKSAPGRWGYTVFKATNGLVERHVGLFPDVWGQRITSLAVFNGRLCAGTGNLSGSPWNPEYHDMIPKALADRYGQVLCAEIPNHTAGAVHWKRSTAFAFKITEKRMAIEQDGVEIAARPHRLRLEDLSNLEAGGTLDLAAGVYGRFRGEVKRVTK